MSRHGSGNRGYRGRLLALGTLMLAALALSGCTGIGNALGIGKSSPDEFAVVRHAALAVPPNFDLRPPTPGAPRPQEQLTREEARIKLLGTAGDAPDQAASQGARLLEQTPAERALLSQTGAGEVPINIREVVRIESAALGVQDRSFTDSLIFWKKPGAPEGEVLDAAKEAERLKRAQGNEGGAPATAPAQDSVVIKRKEGGLFGGLFD